MNEEKTSLPTAEELLEYHVSAQEKAILKQIEKEIARLQARIDTDPFTNSFKKISIEISGRVLDETVERIEYNFENIGYSVKFNRKGLTTGLDLDYSAQEEN